MPLFKQEIEKLLKDSMIAISQYVSPLVCVNKKVGNLRICTDGRYLYSRTQSDYEKSYGIEELLKGCHKPNFLTTLDLSKSFYQFASIAP